MPEQKGPEERTPVALNKIPADVAGVARRERDKPLPDEARTVYPVLFTQPGTDTYISEDDPNPAFSDFRPVAYPAESDVDLGEIVDPEPDVLEGPKDSSAQESANSSKSPQPSEQSAPEQTAHQLEWTPPGFNEDADKDSGTPKENEPSTQTS